MYKRKISVMEECFEAQLKRNAVKSKEQDKSIFDQMNSILGNNKGKFSSVEEKVKEMQQRSGFDKFTQEKSNKKVASDATPDLLVKYPETKSTLDNIIEQSGGLLAIQAVLNKLMGIYEAQIRDLPIWQDPKLTVYIGVENKKAQSFNQKEVSHNLGKTDRSQEVQGDDFLKALMPASGI